MNVWHVCAHECVVCLHACGVCMSVWSVVCVYVFVCAWCVCDVWCVYVLCVCGVCMCVWCVCMSVVCAWVCSECVWCVHECAVNVCMRCVVCVCVCMCMSACSENLWPWVLDVPALACPGLARAALGEGRQHLGNGS